MAEVRVIKLEKKFGDFTAVKNLDLTIKDGEFLTLLGPSGCGKTTTLRCIAGLEQQTGGDIYIGPRVVNDLKAGERDIAMVFQFYALYPHMSAYDNIAFPLRAQRTERAEVDQRVHQAAKSLKIEYLLNRRPNKLGAGEQQRVALGRAMVRRPQVFLMDEPLTNLDARLRAEMRTELKRLHRELGTTVVYVTHDQIEALSMSQRIAIMNKGVLQQVGTPLDVYNNPATLFVAGFIGTPPMNFLPVGFADGEAPALKDATGPFATSLTPEQAARVRAAKGDANLLFGVRSEDVHINPTPEPGDIPAVVDVREPLGDEIIYDLRIGERSMRAKTPPTVRLQRGDQVGVRLDHARIHVYNTATEQAIF